MFDNRITQVIPLNTSKMLMLSWKGTYCMALQDGDGNIVGVFGMG